MELIETVTAVLARAASDPLVADRLTQLWFLFAAQLRLALPLLVRVYVWLKGLNGPPGNPLEISPFVGLTESTPAGLSANAGGTHVPNIRLTHPVSHIDRIALMRHFSCATG